MLDQTDARAMVGWAHDGGFSLDASPENPLPTLDLIALGYNRTKVRGCSHFRNRPVRRVVFAGQKAPVVVLKPAAPLVREGPMLLSLFRNTRKTIDIIKLGIYISGIPKYCT